MVSFSSRSELERRGLSTGKRRRKVQETTFRKALEEGPITRIAIFVVFSIVTSAVLLLFRDAEAVFTGSPIRTILLVSLITATMYVHLQATGPTSFRRNNRVLLTLSALLLHLLFVHIAFLVVRNLGQSTPYLLPAYALAPMILSIMMGRNHGIYAAIYASLLSAMLPPTQETFSFLMAGLLTGLVSVYFFQKLRRRSKIVFAGVYTGLAAMLITLVIGFIPIRETSWSIFGLQAFTAIAASTCSAMLIGGALPVLESMFKVTTVVSWIEMADLNHPLLKKLASDAPGTYHHSLQVSRLSDAAAEAIGANATLCRVASYFHDIGKTNKPQYFIENVNPEENPHNELTPTMSALIITAHVKDGVDLALKYNLHSELIDVIREHHGTTVIQFFYLRAMDHRRKIEKLIAEGKANPEDLPLVEEKDFRYPGPKPRTKESAIISLADSIESASRTLQKPTPAKLEQLIQDITDKRLQDHQLDRCLLTMEDLSKIKKSFHTTLCGMMHNRVIYPGTLQLDDGGEPLQAEGKSTTQKERATTPAEKKEAGGHERRKESA
ncbi:MAG: HDIG domain-containing metalloprotein [Verrucomicrobiota bacterium]